MVRRADARRGKVDGTGFGAGALDQSLRILGHRIEPDREQQGKARHQPDRLEILGRIVGQLLEQGGVEDQRAVVGGEDCIAVGLGLGCRRTADIGRTAGLVLDHQRLAERRRHRLCQDAGERVRAAASRIGPDPGDGPLRKVGPGGAKRERRCGDAGGERRATGNSDRLGH